MARPSAHDRHEPFDALLQVGPPLQGGCDIGQRAQRHDREAALLQGFAQRQGCGAFGEFECRQRLGCSRMHGRHRLRRGQRGDELPCRTVGDVVRRVAEHGRDARPLQLWRTGHSRIARQSSGRRGAVPQAASVSIQMRCAGVENWSPVESASGATSWRPVRHSGSGHLNVPTTANTSPSASHSAVRRQAPRRGLSGMPRPSWPTSRRWSSSARIQNGYSQRRTRVL